MATIALRNPNTLQMRHVNHPDVPDDYSNYPPFVDKEGRKWVHVDPQAFEPTSRRIPVYDLIPD
jgi:hypothetical protein